MRKTLVTNAVKSKGDNGSGIKRAKKVLSRKKYSANKDIQKLVLALIKSGWHCIRANKHPILIAPNGCKITVPSSPSDSKAFHNFKNDISRLSLQC